jgi:hypothetical protein
MLGWDEGKTFADDDCPLVARRIRSPSVTPTASATRASCLVSLLTYEMQAVSCLVPQGWPVRVSEQAEGQTYNFKIVHPVDLALELSVSWCDGIKQV